MIKLLFNTIFTFALLGALVLFFAFNPFVEWRLQNTLQDSLEQTITFESMRLSPFTGSGDIGGVTINGIGEFSEEILLYIPRIDVKFDPFSLWSNTLSIESIGVHDAKIEFSGTVVKNNVSTMVQHLSNMRVPETSTSDELRPFYHKRYTLDTITQKGTRVAIEPNILRGHSISADVPMSTTREPLGGGSATLEQVISFLILDVLSRSPEAITGEFNLLKEGLVGLGLLDKDVLTPKEEKPGFFGRLRNKITNLF